MIIHFDRSSVCMGDDCLSHKEKLEINEDILLSIFIESHILDHLALITGGEATWVLSVKTNHTTYKDIAVIAQQWIEPKLLVQDYTLKELAGDNEIVQVFALYQGQENPNSTYDKLAANR